MKAIFEIFGAEMIGFSRQQKICCALTDWLDDSHIVRAWHRINDEDKAKAHILWVHRNRKSIKIRATSFSPFRTRLIDFLEFAIHRREIDKHAKKNVNEMVMNARRQLRFPIEIGSPEEWRGVDYSQRWSKEWEDGNYLAKKSIASNGLINYEMNHWIHESSRRQPGLTMTAFMAHNNNSNNIEKNAFQINDNTVLNEWKNRIGGSEIDREREHAANDDDDDGKTQMETFETNYIPFSLIIFALSVRD